MRTPTPCPWRFATPAWTSSPIPAPTAITASARGVRISGPRSRTTPPSSPGRASPAKAARSCGCVMRAPGRSRSSTTAISPDGSPSTTATPCLTLPPASPLGAPGPASRSIDIIDVIHGGGHDIRLAFHLGPEVQVEFDDAARSSAGPPLPAGTARLELPPGLRWSLHRGESDPILGWYSPGLGRRVPAFTLWVADVVCRARPWPPDWSSSKRTSHSGPLFRGGPWHGPHPTPEQAWHQERMWRLDEPADAGPAEIRPGGTAAQDPGRHHGGPGPLPAPPMSCSTRRS